MVKINIIRGNTPTPRQTLSETQIKLTPEIAETFMSTGIQIVSLVIMGVVSMVLKQNLFSKQ